MRRLLVLATALATTLTVAGCNSDSTAPGASLAGTYTLQTVNGLPLPVTVSRTGPYSKDVVAGQIVLDANGNYTGVTTYSEYNNGTFIGQYTDRITGYWTLSGSQLTLVDASGASGPYNATVSGNQLTVTGYNQSGYTLVQLFTR
jgi:hypothetical protein